VVLNHDVVDNFERPNDIYVPGDCDESIWSLCQKLGWEKELWKLHNDIGGVGGNWELKEGTESSTAETEVTKVDNTVDQLARELEQELKLDKEEDIELKKAEDIVDKVDDKADSGNDAGLQSKNDADSSGEAGETEAKDSDEAPAKDPKEKL
jgi:hypothetical protein